MIAITARSYLSTERSFSAEMYDNEIRLELVHHLN